MKSEWLANVNGQEYGPYTWQQMRQMAEEGRVPADLPVRRANDTRWFKAAQVPGLVTAAAPSPASVESPRGSKKGDSHLKRAKPLAPAAPAPPVSPPPAPPPTSGIRPPPTSAGQSNGFPVIVTEGPRKAPSRSDEDETESEARRGSPALLVGILASVAVVVLLAGGMAIWFVWIRGSGLRSQSLVASAPKAEANSHQAGAAAHEGKSAETATADRQNDSEVGNGPTKAELAAQVKTVQSIAGWQSVAGVKSFTVSNANMQVMRIWRTESDGDGAEKSSGGKYVCVQVAISNKSRSPLKYRGWNSFGANGAILADEKKNVLPLVPVAKTPELSRMTSGSVPGGGSVTETLVFEATANADDVLYLVLPYSVFYSNVRPPYRAIELTPDVFGVDLASAAPAGGRSNQAPAQVGDALAGPAPTSADAPAAPAGDAAKPGAASEPKGASKGKDGKPPSLRDMINNDPGTPAPLEVPPAVKDGKDAKDPKGKGEARKEDEKPKTPKKPENPFEPKPAANPLDPLSVVPKTEKKGEEP